MIKQLKIEDFARAHSASRLYKNTEVRYIALFQIKRSTQLMKGSVLIYAEKKIF